MGERLLGNFILLMVKFQTNIDCLRRNLIDDLSNDHFAFYLRFCLHWSYLTKKGSKL